MVENDDSRMCEMNLSLFFIVCVSITYSGRNIWSKSETRVFEIVFSGVVPPLFLERWTGFDAYTVCGTGSGRSKFGDNEAS